MTIATLSTSVQQCINNFTAALLRNKTLILQCIGFTFLWGFVAHGFMFANGNLTFDSLGQLIEGGGWNSWKAMLGRMFVPRYEYLVRGVITIPWLLGIIGLFYISLCVVFLCKIFNISSKIGICLFSGILTVNITVIGLIATVISDFDADMLALFMSVLSVFCWHKYHYGWIYGIIPLVIALGLYQSYISTTITLIIIISVWHLLQGKTSKQVIHKGLLAVIMILFAGMIYFVTIQLICTIKGVTLATGSYNSLDAGLSMSFLQIIDSIKDTYIVTLKKFFCVPTMHRHVRFFFLHLLITCVSLLCVIVRLINHNISIGTKILTICLILLMPLGMNISRVLANNMSHDIMHYAIWLTYIFILLIAIWNTQFLTNKYTTTWKYICYGCILFILCRNVILANTTYFIKGVEHDANLSLFTRIVADIEDVPEYELQENEIAFIGQPTHLLTSPLTKNATLNIHGMYRGFPRKNYEYQAYFSYFLMNPARIAEDNVRDSLLLIDAVQAMPLYPAEGSIQKIDSILVVKLGEVEVQP